MGNQKRARHNHWLRNINRKRAMSGEKNEKAILGYIELLKKQEKYGETRWIKNAFEKAETKLKKYGIKKDSVSSVLEKKGLNHLIK
ncbi:hypothetical protein [Candidatus Absconditicoccus praedator]|uniref:hypothetical protein n=1 Tax=Candidatus Absconditicoccus praedator TaxID=2735562 RepID=UPI001E46C357|nr:hypothetical protein [Candidatus Absconditicoccus praedator]UFX83198.1 hypothetical protein HLG78_03650 [Candidatus Absconditicoccus praedator]